MRGLLIVFAVAAAVACLVAAPVQAGGCGGNVGVFNAPVVASYQAQVFAAPAVAYAPVVQQAPAVVYQQQLAFAAPVYRSYAQAQVFAAPAVVKQRAVVAAPRVRSRSIQRSVVVQR